MYDTLPPIAPELFAKYHTEGWWRKTTFIDDLAQTVRDHPDRDAIVGYVGGKHAKTLTYRELADAVERFSGALLELGVGPGDVVVIYLPNWWMLTPLYLACLRIGAVAFPFDPAYAGRELGQALRVTGAKVCVIPDEFNGVDVAARLVDVAADIETHRVVVGNAERIGAIDFDEFFVQTPWEQRHDLSAVSPRDPDDPALLLFTSGTTGEPKVIAHTANTLYAAVRTVSDPFAVTGDDVISIPHVLTHMAGASYSVFMSLLVGATCVMQDDKDMGLLLDMIAEHRVTFLYASPAYVVNLLPAQRALPRDVSSVRHLVSGSAPIPPQLIAEAREVLGVELYALWGMTENGAVTVTRPDDAPGWAANSDGRTEPWMEVRVVPEEDGATIGRLLTRGASQCLGYLNVPDVYAACVDEDGWFDTGDTARDDGRAGIRITGRRDDLITRGDGLKVPTLEVEALLTQHPAVDAAVLLGYPDPAVPGSEKVCAVVVTSGEAPTLEDLHGFLHDEGLMRDYWPDRVDYASDLPRNSLGKIQRRALREQLLTAGVEA